MTQSPSQTVRRAVLGCLLAVLLAPEPTRAAAPSEHVVRSQALLRAWTEADADAVVSQIDPAGFHIYGSDVAEVVDTPAELRQLIADDARLWGPGASFGEPANVSVVQGRDLATVYFDAPFSIRGRPPVIVRFAMTWKRSGGRWRLVQSANVVPTVGSSARELAGGD